MDTVVRDIIKNQKHCYFISPHLDDAVLSAGGLLSYLAGKTPVTIINIFTEAGEKPYTFSTRRFLKHCGFTNGKELYRYRHQEEKNITQTLGIDSINLGFVDGTFRRKQNMNVVSQHLAKTIPEFEHMYPLGRIIFGLAKDDQLLAEEIKKKLRSIVKDDKNSQFFCPLGTVKHMDHMITTNVCTAIFKHIIFWTDFPYIKNAKQTVKDNQFVWDKNQEEKKKLISLYTSQVHMLFPGGRITIQDEIYSRFA